jgi:hypothetical protein
VKCINVKSNRLRYLLTPTGIAEKTRLTYEFMEYSLRLYGQVRQRLRVVLEPAVRAHQCRIALYGTGEAAELAYLSITELGLKLVGIFGVSASGQFLGQEVLPIERHHDVAFDVLLVASLERADALLEQMVELGIARERVVTLRQ